VSRAGLDTVTSRTISPFCFYETAFAQKRKHRMVVYTINYGQYLCVVERRKNGKADSGDGEMVSVWPHKTTRFTECRLHHTG
jgi:hypothetical protein